MHVGMGEIGVLIVLALVLFGAKRLPEVGRAAGSAIREFKLALNADPREAAPQKTEPQKAESDRQREDNGSGNA